MSENEAAKHLRAIASFYVRNTQAAMSCNLYADRIEFLETEIERLKADNHRFRMILKGSEEDYSYLFEDEKKEE